MPKTLILPDDLYKTLKQKSKKKGMMPEEYVLELLKNETARKRPAVSEIKAVIP